MSLQWNELEGTILGKTVGLILPDGAALKGRPVGVNPEALVLNIKKTSDRAAYPKGEFSIPRSSVATLQMNETRGPWRAIGTGIGVAAGAIPGALVYQRFNNEGASQAAAALAAGLIAGGAAAGFLAGRSADRQVTLITIVRD